jgi:hypothetical protein
MVALIKVSLVDQGWVELVTPDAEEDLAGTFPPETEAIPVDVRRGGADELRAALAGWRRGAKRRPVQQWPARCVFRRVSFGAGLGRRPGGADGVYTSSEAPKARVITRQLQPETA